MAGSASGINLSLYEILREIDMLFLVYLRYLITSDFFSKRWLREFFTFMGLY